MKRLNLVKKYALRKLILVDIDNAPEQFFENKITITIKFKYLSEFIKKIQGDQQ